MGELTGTNPMPTIVTPAMVQSYQAQLLGVLDGLDPVIQACTALNAKDWEDLHGKVETWAAEKWLSDYLDPSAEWLQGQRLEAAMQEWRDNAKAQCGYVPPTPPAPDGTGPSVLGGAGGAIAKAAASAVPWVVGGAVVLLVGLVLVEAARE